MPNYSAVKRVIPALAAITMLSSAPTVQAADAVTDALQQAYAPYRVALFKTNMGTLAEAQQAIDHARGAWLAFTRRFGTQPSAPYDRDVRFAATLTAVDKIFNEAASQVAKQQLPQAHDTLEAVREQLADLRHRNGVVVFSDSMNAYHAQMEVVMIDGPKLLAAPRGMIAFAGQAGTLDYLVRRLAPDAPPELTANAEFLSMLSAVRQSVDALQSALREQDAAAIATAISQLKGPYSKLFSKFG